MGLAPNQPHAFFVTEGLRLGALSYTEFIKELPAHLELLNNHKRQVVGSLVLCSHYISPSNWDVWIEMKG